MMVHLSLCAGSCCTARSRATSRNARHHRPRAAHKLVSRGRSNAIWLSKLYPFFLTRSHGLVPPSARTNCGIPFDLHIPIHRRVQDVTHHFIIDPIGPESPVDRKCELVSSNLSLLSLFNFLLVNTCHQPEPPFLCYGLRSRCLSFSRLLLCLFFAPRTSLTYLVSISSPAWNRGHPGKHQHWKLSQTVRFLSGMVCRRLPVGSSRPGVEIKSEMREMETR